jgi:hypothetical protein
MDTVVGLELWPARIKRETDRVAANARHGCDVELVAQSSTVE